ncbi:YbaB/EbfC family nucleoid-associated protein [Salinispora vitiensis]|uniref:YbaB/EbfC family nucleoid-associated protein n=1 Tax=Salinispora vitiensis TaxID=999544 RepID=UPI000380D082|nr:YbaB/EbfC family nucleoid-associated protein [Salinispora vitiensis]
MPLNSEDLLHDWQQRADQHAQLSLEMSRRMQEVTATARSTDDEVEVTVDHTGSMTALRIADYAMRLPAADLSSLVLATSQQAQAKMAQQVGELVQGMYGSDSPTAAFVTGAYNQQFPQPPDEEQERSRR